NMEYEMGSYPKMSISEIWNGPAAQALRATLGRYKLPDSCRVCRADLDAAAYSQIHATHFDRYAHSGNYPVVMEFLISNTCNLECIMCKGEFSSLIRQNREKLPPIQTPYDENFVSQLREFIPYLKEARFSGSGEAFLIDLNFRIWELIIELNPSCNILVQTNGMVLNERIKDLLNRGRFQIGVSLDSLDTSTYEIIRPHARLQRVIENIQWFSSFARQANYPFGLSMCVMRNNWREMPDFIRYANSHGAYATLHKVWQPLKYSLQNLPADELAHIVNYLSSHKLPRYTSIECANADHYYYMCQVIAGWRDRATLYAPADMTVADLHARLLASAHTFWQGESPERRMISNSVTDFIAKLNAMLAMHTVEQDQHEILTMLNYLSFGQVYPKFLKADIQQLYDESVLYLKRARLQADRTF
ncbi:MAG: radical SAM protein, partial [Bacteroidetes bacterium]|nr:radical SAM protein [Bacteroidota bacterium]